MLYLNIYHPPTERRLLRNFLRDAPARCRERLAYLVTIRIPFCSVVLDVSAFACAAGRSLVLRVMPMLLFALRLRFVTSDRRTRKYHFTEVESQSTERYSTNSPHNSPRSFVCRFLYGGLNSLWCCLGTLDKRLSYRVNDFLELREISFQSKGCPNGIAIPRFLDP
jgi:hypothetical protein